MFYCMAALCFMCAHWEIIADNLSQAGWSWGRVSALDREGRTFWIVDAHRGDGKRFVGRADEKLTVFLELQSAIRHHCFNRQCVICVESVSLFRRRAERS
jgi:hypothetical protein